MIPGLPLLDFCVGQDSRRGRGQVSVGGIALSAAALRSTSMLVYCGASTTHATHSVSSTIQKAGERSVGTVPSAPSGSTLLVTFHADTSALTGSGRAIAGTVPASWPAPSVLPVIGSRGDDVEVRLAQRPNESTAWVKASDVGFSSTPYRIVPDLATTHLMLYKTNKLILSAPAGIGTPRSPTPPGDFFVAFFAQATSAGTGPSSW